MLVVIGVALIVCGLVLPAVILGARVDEMDARLRAEMDALSGPPPEMADHLAALRRMTREG